MAQFFIIILAESGSVLFYHIYLDRAESLFMKITNRENWHDPNDRYEHFAFIKVDFSTDPPTIIPTCQELSIETFFDKLIATHNDRNLFNPL